MSLFCFRKKIWKIDMSLRPRDRKKLELEAEKNPSGPAAQVLKVILQEEAKASDLLRQASEQAKRDSTREKILIGAAILKHAEQNLEFKKGLERVLSRNITTVRDRDFLKKFGWEIENENTHQFAHNNTAITR